MNPVAVTPLGRLHGVLGADGVERYLGVPYASVPARFEPARPVGPWTDVRDASAYGPAAPQVPTMLEKLLSGDELPLDEAGCLTLNVWTPAADGGGRPVLVWIHGGAFATGTGRSRWYDGAALARRGDVVVVTINYRLGVLGFTHGLTPGSGNLGLLDQIEALRWVQANIAALGGDPGNVTVFGESAGGCSVVALLAADAAAGLFQRAVAQSPSLTQIRSVERAAEGLAELCGAAGTDDAGLRSMDVTALVDAQNRLFTDNHRGITASSPTADGVVLPATLAAVQAAAAAHAVPLLLGTTRDEMALFTAFDTTHAAMDEAMLDAIARRTFGEAGAGAVEAYRTERPGAGPSQLATAIATDHTFRIPAVRLAEARAAAGTPTWLYRFTWPSPAFGGVLGACHGIEIPFVFHNLHQPGVELFLGTGAERAAIADATADAWLSFARSGRAAWPAYEPAGERAVLRIDTDLHVESDPEGGTRRVWDDVPTWP